MKKLITMAVAILVTGCIAAFASGKAPVASSQKQFEYQLSFTKIVVDDDIDLQLNESNDRRIELKGKDADVENVSWKIKNGTLYIESKRGSLKDKVKATISVNGLKEIFIKGESAVSSAGALVSPSLYVYMNSDCSVAIKNAGRIYVVNSHNSDVDIMKITGDVQVGR